MATYQVLYKGKFFTDVKADSKDEAIDKAEYSSDWEAVGDLDRESAEVYECHTGDVKSDDTEITINTAVIKILKELKTCSCEERDGVVSRLCKEI